MRISLQQTVDIKSQFKSSTVKDFIPGYELSGEVLEVGEGVKPDAIAVGERVAVLSKNRGGFAEQCIVDSGDVWRLPSNINRKDAAVLIFGHTNALYAFSHLCTLKEDTNIIITTGPAGLGLAAIDIAANIYKAKPVGVSNNEELLSLVRERGAFTTATFKSKNFAKELKNADIIYDAVGGGTHKLLSACIKPEGKILCAGPVDSQILTPPLNTWLSVVNIEGMRKCNFDLYRNLVSETLDMADQGMISAYVSEQFNLVDIDKAIKFIEDNKCTGKVLIKVSD
ncbi:hypothetical protein CBL_00417 [Carabus blaptoides fortunei]